MLDKLKHKTKVFLEKHNLEFVDTYRISHKDLGLSCGPKEDCGHYSYRNIWFHIGTKVYHWRKWSRAPWNY